MANSRNGRKTSGPLAVIVALLVGWAIVVIVSAGTRPQDAPLLGVQNMGTLLFGVLLVLVVLSVIFLIVVRPRRDGDIPETVRTRQPWFFLAVVTFIFWIWRPDFIGMANRPIEEQTAVLPGDTANQESIDEPAAESVAELTDLLVVAFIIAIVAAIWFWARYRGTQEAPPVIEEVDEHDDALEADLLVALDDASTELATTDDPRVAVMNAYAALEQVLAAHDRKRLRSETPTEHVRRSVEFLRIDADPLVHLGELYSLARFSDHEITPDQQRRAGVALEQARDELATRS